MFNVNNENLEEKEQEIITSYNEETFDDYRDEETDNYEEPTDNTKKYKRIINIFFIVILVIIAMITTDYIRVAKYEKKPLFAIKTKTYKDGGTKVYTGLGYKVIDYNQLQGRRDIEIGTWSIKYNNKPVTYQDIDLAIAFNDDEEKTYKENYKKFVRIVSTLKSVDKKNKKLILGYTDEDGKYSLDISCDLVAEQLNIDKFEENKQITIIGTIKDYKVKTNKNNRRIYIKDCIAEQ